MSLNVIYEKGNYWLGITIYRTGQALPRKLAPENKDFLRDGLAVVDERSCIYLTPGRQIEKKVLWYRDEDGWKPGEWTGKMWQIPGNVFQYCINTQVPLYSARLPIAVQEPGSEPAADQERMLVIHFLKKPKTGGGHHAKSWL